MKILIVMPKDSECVVKKCRPNVAEKRCPWKKLMGGGELSMGLFADKLCAICDLF